MKVFRLCGAHRDPKDATGSFKRGGRWNSPGNAVLYCASTLSLACLEYLVHLRDPANLPPLVYVEISVADLHIRLWASNRERSEAILESQVLSREVGDEWMRSRLGPLSREPIGRPMLQVPSAIIPQEWNYLINPASSLFRDIVWSEPAPFRIDPRLL
jgi:RES domain-containing protein